MRKNRLTNLWVPYLKKQRITVDTLKTDIDTVKNDIQSIKELLFGFGNNGNKDEATPSGSETPDKTILNRVMVQVKLLALVLLFRDVYIYALGHCRNMIFSISFI